MILRAGIKKFLLLRTFRESNRRAESFANVLKAPATSTLEAFRFAVRYFYSNYSVAGPSKEYSKYINFGTTPRTQTCTRARVRTRARIHTDACGRSVGVEVVRDGDRDTLYSYG